MLKSLFRKAVSKPSETQTIDVYVVYENGRLLGLSTSLAASSTLQGEYPNADLLVVEIDFAVWQILEKRTKETIDELSR